MKTSTLMPNAKEALPGRTDNMAVSDQHFINGHSIRNAIPENMALAQFAMGCFWGAERRFWQLDGVYATAVGYAGGHTPNPTYREVCSGQTAHAEVVLVIYDPEKVDYQLLLETFWQSHDPTQGMRQGNDIGSQYRSAIYTYDDDQYVKAKASKAHYQQRLFDAELSEITTEIQPATTFYYAEDDHQQYLGKNPSGYCGLGGTGVNYQ